MTDTKNRARSLLVEVLEQTTGEQEDYLVALAQGDEALEQKLRAMLVTAKATEKYFDNLPHRFALPKLLGFEASAVQTPPSPVEVKPILRVKGVEDDAVDAFFNGFQEARSPQYEGEEEYAQGGLGRVLTAYDRRLKRLVAIKEIREDKDTPQLRKRFAREALITAQLEHPGIVPVHEVGVRPVGTPYYTMKFIHGRSLKELVQEKTTFADRLPILANVLMVADAVAYAHSKQVVHRDLKPDNIIVGDYGETVVIDWGIAKSILAHEHETQATFDDEPRPEVTKWGTILGTPGYMSPEQARGEDADARADVYALGAILYYVLSGRAPYTGNSSEEILREMQIRPPAPLDTWIPVRADLLTVVNTAMAPNPTDRYPNAQAFRDELQRYQNDQLVQAHRYPAHERLLRWARMSVVPILASVLVSILAIWGIFLTHNRYLAWQQSRRVANIRAVCQQEANRIFSIWDADAQNAVQTGVSTAEPRNGPHMLNTLLPALSARAESWKEQAQQSCLHAHLHQRWSPDQRQKSQWCLNVHRSEFGALVKILSDTHSKVAWRGIEAVSGLPPLDFCTDEISLQGMPEVPPVDQQSTVEELQRKLAQVTTWQATGQFAQALEMVEGMQNTAGSVGWRPLLASVLRLKARLLGDLGRYPAARAASKRAYLVATESRHWREASLAALDMMDWLGDKSEKFEESLFWGEQARVAIMYAGDPAGYLEALRLRGVGRVLDHKGAYRESILKLQQALQRMKDMLGLEHPLAASIYTRLADVRRTIGEYDAAIELDQQAIQIRKLNLGSNHPSISDNYNSLGIIWYWKGQYHEAIKAWQQSLQIKQKALGNNHAGVGLIYNNLGLVWLKKGEYDRAIDVFQRALKIKRNIYGNNHFRVANAYGNLGEAWYLKGQYDRAIEFYQKDISIRRTTLGEQHSTLGESYTNMGRVWAEKGEYDRAISYYTMALDIRREGSEAEHPELVSTYRNLGLAWAGKGDYRRAATFFEKALAIGRTALGEEHPDIGAIYESMALMYAKKGDEPKAKSYYHRALDIFEAKLGGEHPSTQSVRQQLQKQE